MRLTTRGVLVATVMVAAACTIDSGGTAPTSHGTLRSATPDVSRTATCGGSVVEDLRLEEDLSCPGDGLIVGADGININLNGHTITGAGVGNGITVRGRERFSIFGGTIQGFVTGILIATSTGVVVKDNGFTGNREAVFLNGSSANTVKHNAAWANLQRGIMVRPTGAGVISTDNVLMDNELTNNPSGILLFGQPGNMIKANTISESTVAALDLTGGGASDNVFKANLLTNNAAAVKFGAGWTNNTFLANRIWSNTCGFQGTTTGNFFVENLLIANVTDVCP